MGYRLPLLATGDAVMSYVIMHNHRDPEDDAPLFWNNTDGWCWLSEADTFTPDERATLHLPLEAWGWLLLPTMQVNVVE